ncbi:MAG: hypothetical protein PVG53_00720 [Holophagae bacterium]|jgi:fructokinase
MNVVRHVLAMGLDPLLVTRVGDDEPGRRTLDVLVRLGADPSGVQIDGERPTWRAGADGDAACAWDGFDPEAAVRVVESTAPPLAFQTTTAARSDGARAALRSIRESTGVPFFVDVDLNLPWLRPGDLGTVLLGARWLRIPSHQVVEMAAIERDADEDPELAAAREVLRRFALATVIVELHGIPVTVVSNRDVSKGSRPDDDLGSVHPTIRDAAAAALVAGLACSWPTSVMLQRTVKLVRLLTEAAPPERLDHLFHDFDRPVRAGEGDRP